MKNKTQEEIRTYNKDYCCLNCGMNFTQSFQFGQIATQGKCPHRGVNPRQLSKPTYMQPENWT